MADRKIILITGASSGLGLAITKSLSASDSFEVVATARKISQELKDICDTHENCHFHRLDLLEHGKLQGWVAELTRLYGKPYGLINNAAIARDGVLATMHDSEISDLISTNVISTILLTKYVSRKMLAQKEGRIINISSVIASTGYSGLSVYAASKSAIEGFTKSLSRELGRLGVTVNAIAPGYMKTKMTSGIEQKKLDQIARRSALKRLVSVDEVANSVEFLLSESAASITGITLTVDAGNTA